MLFTGNLNTFTFFLSTNLSNSPPLVKIKDLQFPIIQQYKLENEEDMFNLELAIDYKIDEKLIDQLRFPGKVNNAYSDRGQNSTNKETIDE